MSDIPNKILIICTVRTDRMGDAFISTPTNKATRQHMKSSITKRKRNTAKTLIVEECITERFMNATFT